MKMADIIFGILLIFSIRSFALPAKYMEGFEFKITSKEGTEVVRFWESKGKYFGDKIADGKVFKQKNISIGDYYLIKNHFYEFVHKHEENKKKRECEIQYQVTLKHKGKVGKVKGCDKLLGSKTTRFSFDLNRFLYKGKVR